MKCYCCNERNDCAVAAVVTSIIIGIITAFLRFSAVITVTPAFLWVVFGVAIGFLAITFVIATLGKYIRNDCICRGLPYLLTGILGTVFTSLVLLAIEFVATSVIGAIITGALLAFFFLILTSVACISICAKDCYDKDDDC